MRLTERLPVALIPEQLLIASVWLDVIHYRCRRYSAFSLAVHAQGMITKERLSRLLPLVTVAALSGCLARSPAIWIDRLEIAAYRPESRF